MEENHTQTEGKVNFRAIYASTRIGRVTLRSNSTQEAKKCWRMDSRAHKQDETAYLPPTTPYPLEDPPGSAPDERRRERQHPGFSQT